MEESTQEGDDETVIVYGQQSVENPWEFSQASRKSQDPTNPTRQSENENSQQHQSHCRFDHQEEAPSSNWIPRKRRHRSLGRSRNFRRRNDPPTVDQGIRDEDLSHEGVDGFASLRHLLSERSLSQERLLDGGRESHSDIPKEKDEDENSTENVPIQNSCQETENRQLCSPPDFDLCTSDNDDDDDDDDFENENSWRMKNHHKKISSSGKTKLSANRSNKSSRRRSDEPKRFSAVPSAVVSSSTNSRKRNRPETISRRVFSSSLNSQKDRQPDSSLPTQLATNVENVKSIVGLRYVTS